ncbi:MAG: GIY-YIG nuclease family protein [Turicibacter sp.]|nr:GIY-YIG nuclease family protein [Turicibacter sp.]
MATRGKSINLFLMDGDPSGRIKCTLATWTGVAYKIPRTELDKCKGRDDLSQSGVYFLFGTSDETGESVVYIGQAGVRKNGEGILTRLQEHKRNTDKDYWTEAVVFTTSNNSFGPTEISYLENKFTNLALAAKRYVIKNGNDPTLGNITEEKESELEEFLDYAKIIMGTLGHKVFESLTEVKPIVETNIGDDLNIADVILYLNRNNDNHENKIRAIGKRSNEGFIVLKESVISNTEAPSTPKKAKEEREKAKASNFVVDNVLQRDILFKSPSTAAAFVVGGSVNGMTEWKIDDGKTLKDIENSEGTG